LVQILKELFTDLTKWYCQGLDNHVIAA